MITTSFIHTVGGNHSLGMWCLALIRKRYSSLRVKKINFDPGDSNTVVDVGVLPWLPWREWVWIFKEAHTFTRE